jgi:ABC-2 type transport system permease protein
MFAVYKKELKVYFTGILGYIVMGIYLLMAGIFFFGIYVFSASSTSDLSPFFGMMNSWFLLIIPILTLRILAEDKKLGTYELLLTSPRSSWEIIIGKFLGVLTFVLTGATLLLVFPLVLSFFAPIEWGAVLSGYLGMVFSLAFFVSIGMAASSFTDNFVIAGIISFGLFFMLFLISAFGDVQVEFLANLMREISFSHHYEQFAKGFISLKNFLYFILGTFIWLFVAKNVVESKTWK